MYQELARKAIQAALAQDWHSATEINLEILLENPDDVGALNRISQSYLRQGQLDNAQKNANKVFEIDPLNSIALKCIEKCEAFKNKQIEYVDRGDLPKLQNLFIEEPGNTKIISLINICEVGTLATLDPGQEVNMIPRLRRVVITTTNSEYIGRLPDDLAARIIYMVNNGREYTSHVKSTAKDGVRIFVRDVSNAASKYQAKTFKT